MKLLDWLEIHQVLSIYAYIRGLDFSAALKMSIGESTLSFKGEKNQILKVALYVTK